MSAQAPPPGSPRRRRDGVAFFIVMSALLLALAAAATIAAAMWGEARRTGTYPATFGTSSLVLVVLVRQDSTWIVESVGPLGSNPNYDVSDPERAGHAFLLSGTVRGNPRAWEQTWTIGPQPPAGTKPKDPRRDSAREALAAAIRRGSVAWPTELAQSDSARLYEPFKHLQNGIERSPLLLLIMAAPLPFVAVMVRRRRRRARAGMCIACDYSRMGLPVTAQCPECGTLPASPASRTA